MPTVWSVALIATIAGVGGTGLGGILGSLLRRDSQKMVSLLLSGAAGVMLGIVCFDLLTTALGSGAGSTAQRLTVVSASMLAGYGVVLFLNRLIDRGTDKEVDHFGGDHPKTADDLGELIHSKHYEVHREKHSGLFAAGIVMACAIALHNIPEGIVIGASYAKDSGVILAGSGFVMAVVMGLHNIPEGMAVAVPLISGGARRLHAIFLTALSGAPTVIGAVIGYFVGTISPLSLSISLGFASGAMLYVVFGELLPEAFLIWRSKLPSLSVMIGLVVSLVIIYL